MRTTCILQRPAWRNAEWKKLCSFASVFRPFMHRSRSANPQNVGLRICRAWKRIRKKSQATVVVSSACLAAWLRFLRVKDSGKSILRCFHITLKTIIKLYFSVVKFGSDNVTSAMNDDFYISIGFLTWPIIRYKREVLFGWVDLLVSFGGIAGLFLGFSLLSALEIVYFFTIRAGCMYATGRVLKVFLKKCAMISPTKFSRKSCTGCIKKRLIAQSIITTWVWRRKLDKWGDHSRWPTSRKSSRSPLRKKWTFRSLASKCIWFQQ